MSKLLSKILILSVIVLFAQCSKLGYMNRRYTKGHYKPTHSEVATKKSKSVQSEKLPEIDVKTEISLDTKAPVEPILKEEITASTKKEISKAPVTTKKKSIKLFEPKKIDAKTAKLLSKMPFSAKLLEKANKAESSEGGGSSIAAMILSIVGFAAGLGGFLLTFGGIIDSISMAITSSVAVISPLFMIALILGVLALGCGIAALIIGKKEMPSYQRTFAILAIVFGAVALLISGVWSMIFYSIGA